MERVGSVQAVSVLGFGVVAIENRVWMPALAVEIGMVGREAAGLAVSFLRLQPFFGGAEGWIGLAVRSLEKLVGCGLPIALLH